MSLITRCTACETLFRVVPDQLRVSEGWVRCGQCGEIFDGARNLVEGELPTSLVLADPPRHSAHVEDSGTTVSQPAEEPESTPGPASENTTPPAPDAHSAAPAADARLGESEALGPVDESAFTQAAAARDTASNEPVPVGSHARPEALGSSLPSVDEPAPSPLPTDIRVADAESGAQPDDMAPAPSFMRASTPPSRWQRTGVRAALAGLSLALLSVLAAQIARHERDRLAAWAPAWRPALAQLCAWTRCSVEAPRQIESVVIDSSSFARVRGDVYQLAFSLRNSAPIDLAMPSVELSVTNSQDQSLSRRVLGPAELGASLPVIAAGMDWSARITLHVRTATPSDRIAGYRLLAFYP